MLDDGNAGGEQQRVCGPFAVVGVVDVEPVDADEDGAAGGEPGSAGTGEEVALRGVGRCTKPGVVAGVQQHGLALDVVCSQCANVDSVLPGSGYPHDDGGKIDGAGQGDGAEVRAVGIAVVGRVEVGPGVADQRELVDGELGAGA
jgi:hypothetical protein